MSRRPMRFSVHRIVRGVFQIMTVAGVHIKRLQRGELRQVTRAGGIHLGAQPRRTVGHHRQSPRAGERFKVRPDQHGLRPEVLEGLEKIPSTAIVGEHAIHALEQPVPVGFRRAVPARGDVLEDFDQGLEELVSHLGGDGR